MLRTPTVILIYITFFCLSSLSIAKAGSGYVPDILGGRFEQTTITMPNDYEGQVVCTLVRLKCKTPTTKAVLYIHGFCDYFFQTDMAERYVNEGYNFYAIDLRKYGRSLLSNQYPYNMKRIKEYFPDIDTALSIIKSEGNDWTLLSGHSAGGLIATLYAYKFQEKPKYQALFLNSPFFDLNVSYVLKRLGVPLISEIGKYSPGMSLSPPISTFYGESLHKNFYGEWDYDLNWKPLKAYNVTAGWLRGISKAQKVIQKGITVNAPILVMCSDHTVSEKKWSEDYFYGDAVLNVNDIQKHAAQIQSQVTIKVIPNGMHDLVLSRPEVRDEVYHSLFSWLLAVQSARLKTPTANGT